MNAVPNIIGTREACLAAKNVRVRCTEPDLAKGIESDCMCKTVLDVFHRDQFVTIQTTRTLPEPHGTILPRFREPYKYANLQEMGSPLKI